jgi:hypothetical protein
VIVVDENIQAKDVIAEIAGWYTGQVISITRLRHGTLIKDDAVPTLLHSVRFPTFVTTNVNDFWQVVDPHPAYCILCFAFPRERLADISPRMRQILRLPEFKTKAVRMGKIARIADRRIMYYSQDRQIKLLQN